VRLCDQEYNPLARFDKGIAIEKGPILRESHALTAPARSYASGFAVMALPRRDGGRRRTAPSRGAMHASGSVHPLSCLHLLPVDPLLRPRLRRTDFERRVRFPL